MSVTRNRDDLVRIAAAGGGVRLAADAYTTEILTHVATAAAKSRARVTIVNSNVKSTDDLIRIAAAGQGCVAFE